MGYTWGTRGVHAVYVGPSPGCAGGSEPPPSPHRAVQSPKRMSLGRAGRDRFTAESYTVLGESRGRCRGVMWGTEGGMWGTEG